MRRLLLALPRSKGMYTLYTEVGEKEIRYVLLEGKNDESNRLLVTGPEL